MREATRRAQRNWRSLASPSGSAVAAGPIVGRREDVQSLLEAALGHGGAGPDLCDLAQLENSASALSGALGQPDERVADQGGPLAEIPAGVQ